MRVSVTGQCSIAGFSELENGKRPSKFTGDPGIESGDGDSSQPGVLPTRASKLARHRSSIEASNIHRGQQARAP
jgi:hypothetical protein